MNANAHTFARSGELTPACINAELARDTDLSARERGAVVRAIVGQWHRTPEARAAIQACLDAGIRKSPVFQTFALTRDEWSVYDHPLADKVRAIRDAAGDRICETYTPGALQDWSDMTVERAIDEAYEQSARV